MLAHILSLRTNLPKQFYSESLAHWSMQDLLDNLLLARDEEGTGMADAALRDELMTLLVAGQVSGLCCCSLAKLCVHDGCPKHVHDWSSIMVHACLSHFPSHCGAVS